MIWTITPNPALDLTYRLDSVALGATNRVEQVSIRPGGKGLNVARVLAALGEPVGLAGFLGGRSGDEMRALIADLPDIASAPSAWVSVAGATRRTVTVVADEVTMFSEPGCPVSAANWTALATGVCVELADGDVVSVSGSLPASTPSGTLATLVSQLHEAGARVLVDTSGPWLLEAARAGADLLKPNHHELAEATGSSSLSDGVAALFAAGARGLAVSSGADGMGLWLADSDRFWTAGSPPVSGNPTGAGDAAVAAWCQGLAAGHLDGHVLVSAVATAAAAVAAEVAGEIDFSVREHLLTQVKVQEHRVS